MTDGVGVSEAARRLSISMKTLANWVRAAKDGKLENVGQSQKPLTEIEAELGRLKRELAEVKMERDLLKNISKGAPLPEGQKLSDASTLMRIRESGRSSRPASGLVSDRFLVQSQGSLQPSSNSLRRLTRTFAGISQRGSKSRSALSARSNTGRV
jgi:transposase